MEKYIKTPILFEDSNLCFYLVGDEQENNRKLKLLTKQGRLQIISFFDKNLITLRYSLDKNDSVIETLLNEDIKSLTEIRLTTNRIYLRSNSVYVALKPTNTEIDVLFNILQNHISVNHTPNIKTGSKLHKEAFTSTSEDFGQKIHKSKLYKKTEIEAKLPNNNNNRQNNKPLISPYLQITRNAKSANVNKTKPTEESHKKMKSPNRLLTSKTDKVDTNKKNVELLAKEKYPVNKMKDQYLEDYLFDLSDDDFDVFDFADEINKEEISIKKYQDDYLLDALNIIENIEPFKCVICMETIQPKKGVRINECLHEFCKEDLRDYILHSTEVIIKCPSVGCTATIHDHEISGLVNEDERMKILNRGLMLAEANIEHGFKCQTPNCNGFCINDLNVQWFHCPLCKQRNCTRCEAIHNNKSCKEYQEEIQIKKQNDANEKQTKKSIRVRGSKKRKIREGILMYCPNKNCRVLIEKTPESCDSVICYSCKLQICWATKGPRWGPKGKGDTSGGCHCDIVNGQRCHESCTGCH